MLIVIFLCPNMQGKDETPAMKMWVPYYTQQRCKLASNCGNFLEIIYFGVKQKLCRLPPSPLFSMIGSSHFTAPRSPLLTSFRAVSFLRTLNACPSQLTGPSVCYRVCWHMSLIRLLFHVVSCFRALHIVSPGRLYMKQ